MHAWLEHWSTWVSLLGLWLFTGAAGDIYFFAVLASLGTHMFQFSTSQVLIQIAFEQVAVSLSPGPPVEGMFFQMRTGQTSTDRC